MGIIHHEDIRLWIFRKVALGDVLPVATEVGERQRGLVQYLDKTLRSAAMLDIGLAVRRGGREIEAVGLSQQARKIVVDLGAPAAALLDVGIRLARSLAGLDRFHRGRERDVAG